MSVLRPTLPDLLTVTAIASLCVVGCTKFDSTKTPEATTAVENSTQNEWSYENPGGMWMPGQMTEHTETLDKLGVEFDPKALLDPTSFPLGAVVSLGGCSASFVSDEGLIVTNHHCVQGPLQYNSTPEDNLIKNGFLAKTKGEEKWAGPSSRVFVTKSFKDVTAQILPGLEDITDPTERYAELEKRVKALDEACEERSEQTRCRIASYFEGAQYFEIESLEIKDVRLVYAPDAGIGVFGGEIDNWRWPRHTGDYSFLRAYVAPDGSSAEHSADNVPYKPPHHLKVSTDQLEQLL
ncbi:MAG: S46 family peptidase [Cyanobacteria bacterium P01_F01_bin.3]